MALDNDTRGWIMTCVSGVACVLGSSIICIDVIVRLFPGKSHFRIQDSSSFLSASLSLSFGVMLFSALYSMLPSSKSSLIRGGFTPTAAAWILIAGFLGGVVGIQLVSRLMHHYIPSHVVDCDHSHDEIDETVHSHSHSHPHSHIDNHAHGQPHLHLPNQSNGHSTPPKPMTETTPLLSSNLTHESNSIDWSNRDENTSTLLDRPISAPPRRTSYQRKLSFQAQITNHVSSLVNGVKASCGQGGPCFGYSDPCGQECFKHLQSKPLGENKNLRGPLRQPALRFNTAPLPPSARQHLLTNLEEESSNVSSESEQGRGDYFQSDHRETSPFSHGSPAAGYKQGSTSNSDAEGDHYLHIDAEDDEAALSPRSKQAHELSHSHHHHVPANAFLSIGLQTSIAIALHKLPEGFITYATNHANPKLGFSVFMALFIHNITEGFALALPLFLALNSRWKAMLWSSLLGGVSQPLGAAVAAAWFKIAGKSDNAPGEGVYGVMFAVTSGIMTSVALSLFSESLVLNHNKGLCTVFAFVGMGILGISFALTAE